MNPEPGHSRSASTRSRHRGCPTPAGAGRTAGEQWAGRAQARGTPNLAAWPLAAWLPPAWLPTAWLPAAWLLAAIVLAPAMAHAAPEQLKGSRFIEVMQDNSLSGTTADGAAYNLYFLPGGEVTYDDSSGARDRGRWSMQPDGDVCISFDRVDAGRAHCYEVEVDGRTVTWRGREGGQATLRGGVAESFLRPR
jgi:hypothetical protein